MTYLRNNWFVLKKSFWVLWPIYWDKGILQTLLHHLYLHRQVELQDTFPTCQCVIFYTQHSVTSIDYAGEEAGKIYYLFCF